jgi:hypothetical protein
VGDGLSRAKRRRLAQGWRRFVGRAASIGHARQSSSDRTRSPRTGVPHSQVC